MIVLHCGKFLISFKIIALIYNYFVSKYKKNWSQFVRWNRYKSFVYKSIYQNGDTICLYLVHIILNPKFQQLHLVSQCLLVELLRLKFDTFASKIWVNLCKILVWVHGQTIRVRVLGPMCRRFAWFWLGKSCGRRHSWTSLNFAQVHSNDLKLICKVQS